MPDYLPDVSSIVLGVAGFLFGFYQLHRADRARRDEQRAQREIAELQADRSEAAALRDRRFTVYREHLAKIDGINSLLSEGVQQAGLVEARASMFEAIKRGDPPGEVVAVFGQRMIESTTMWTAQAARITNETQELRLVASPKILPLLADYLAAIKDLSLVAVSYLDVDSRSLLEGEEPGVPLLYEEARERALAIGREIQDQMRRDLGSDL